jgi:hypothetical protein
MHAMLRRNWAACERSKGRPGWTSGEVSAQGKNGKLSSSFFHTFL